MYRISNNMIMNIEENSILLVDDNPHILASLPPLLSQHIGPVTTCVHPEQVLPMLEKESFAIILLDMNFTAGAHDGQEGYACLQQVLRHDPRSLVVLLTGGESIDMALAGVRDGAADFVIKPWNAEKLIANLKLLLRIRTLEGQVEQLGHLLQKKTRNESLKLEDIEKQSIEKAVYIYRGNMSHAARQLGVTRATLYAKMKKYGIDNQ